MTFDRARQQVRFHELLRRFGASESPAAVKIAVLAIARDFRSAAPVSATAVNSRPRPAETGKPQGAGRFRIWWQGWVRTNVGLADGFTDDDRSELEADSDLR